MRRSFEEVKARSMPILGDRRIMDLVAESSSPTAAFEMIMAETKDQERAKAGRWLAILRRDHLSKYEIIISNQVTLPQHDNGKEGHRETELH